MKRRMPMMLRLRNHTVLLVAIAAVLTLGLAQTMSAQDDVFHMAKGVVKSIDKGTKTMVVKTADGTEHTIKWTDKTTVDGGKDIGDGIKEGSKVSVKYTEKAGEKTAVGVKDVGKATAKAVQ
jgi:Cu/Ag efflux protein CusF